MSEGRLDNGSELGKWLGVRKPPESDSRTVSETGDDLTVVSGLDEGVGPITETNDEFPRIDTVLGITFSSSA